MSANSLELELSASELQRIDALARSTQRTPVELATEALRRFLDLETWQVQDIRDGLSEADAGEFASPDEVRETFRRYGA